MRHDEPLVRGYAVTHPTGVVRLPTAPGWRMVLCALSGALVAETEARSWVIPADRALYVGDDIDVDVRTRGPTAVRCLYFRSAVPGLVTGTRVLAVPALLRELIVDAVERCPLDLDDPVDAARVTLVVHLLDRQPAAPLDLPLPRDSRARGLADSIVAHPARPLAEATEHGSASRRTFERIFRAETGMTLAGWQRRARLLAAVGMLAGGTTVTSAATAVGYSTPSAFAAAFRSELGAPPSEYVVTR